MLIVYIPGCWDLLHRGHVEILRRARSLGDTLIVGVASDAAILEDKGAAPVVTLEDRLLMLQELESVSFAAAYYSLDFMNHLTMFMPDVLAVGETWGTARRHFEAEKWAVKNNRRFIKLPYTHGVSTTAIKARICEAHCE